MDTRDPSHVSDTCQQTSAEITDVVCSRPLRSNVERDQITLLLLSVCQYNINISYRVFDLFGMFYTHRMQKDSRCSVCSAIYIDILLRRIMNDTILLQMENAAFHF